MMVLASMLHGRILSILTSLQLAVLTVRSKFGRRVLNRSGISCLKFKWTRLSTLSHLLHGSMALHWLLEQLLDNCICIVAVLLETLILGNIGKCKCLIPKKWPSVLESKLFLSHRVSPSILRQSLTRYWMIKLYKIQQSFLRLELRLYHLMTINLKSGYKKVLI